jgi:hypothetical protein
MSKEKIPILNPFVIDIEPMEKLLLVNFEKDPDAFYIGFEPQVFADAVHGKSIVTSKFVCSYYAFQLCFPEKTCLKSSC